MPAEYRIEFQVQRRLPGEEDFTEIGFGSSGASGDVDGAGYAVETMIQRREWETADGQPGSETVDKEEF